MNARATRRVMVCVDGDDYLRAAERNLLEANEEADADGHVAWVHDYEPDRRVAVDRLDRVTVHKLHLP